MSEAENLIQGQGTPLRAWQGSQALAATPWIDVQQLRAGFQRLVIVAPHPDDEVLGCASLLLTLAGQEQHLLVIAVTDGEASHLESGTLTPEQLRRERPLESRAALEQLGLNSERVTWCRLGLADSDAAAGAARLQAALREQLRPGDTVLTTWRHDGHCDHETVGAVCAQVTQSLGLALIEVPVWAWHWADPEDSRLPWARAHRVALGPQGLARKRAAVAAHVTQLAEQGTHPAVLTEAILQRLLQPFELVFL